MSRFLKSLRLSNERHGYMATRWTSPETRDWTTYCEETSNALDALNQAGCLFMQLDIITRCVSPRLAASRRVSPRRDRSSTLSSACHQLAISLPSACHRLAIGLPSACHRLDISLRTAREQLENSLRTA